MNRINTLIVDYYDCSNKNYSSNHRDKPLPRCKSDEESLYKYYMFIIYRACLCKIYV
ncbi:hypothetical protein [Paraclostridium bifermentans]|uniref:hypothetical protein n=1 Tax=Paraclostridium bifermentans TaxID=1490 RepID=UPI0021C2F3E7|nr:hypothetical protein [Paraclostridium bifermentans]